MAELKVLYEGYARYEGDVLVASPTAVLIIDNGMRIIVDPGSNKGLFLEALCSESLQPEDIHAVFITHHHPDHVLNIRLFPCVPVYDGHYIYKEDKIIHFTHTLPETSLEVIPTPGHCREHWSLLVPTEQGKVAVAGDVFWWMDNQVQKTDIENLLSLDDTYAENKKMLHASRKRLLARADIIIPGHGKMFKVIK